MRLALIIALLCTPILAQATEGYCFKEVGIHYGIAPLVLQVIAQHESRMNPGLVLRNSNGSIDVGLMGINSINFAELKRVGIDPVKLTDPCTNIIARAYLMSKKIAKYGYTWDAIGASHSETPEKRVIYRDIIRTKVERYASR